MESGDKKALLDMEVRKSCWTCSKREKLRLLIFGFALFTFMMVGGYLLADKYTDGQKSVIGTPLSTAHDKIVHSIKAENIRENLRYLTRLPHTAGTLRNYQLALYLKKFYEKVGFDRVEIAEYDVLLTYPKEPGQISIRDKERGDVLFQSHIKETPLWKGEDSPGVTYPFAAYSPPGTVQGKAVYVNYGTAEDFRVLKKMGVNLTGCIAMARYGINFRGNKVDLAKEAGAVGVILYSDPIDYAQGGGAFPQSWWLPEDGVQHGDIRTVGEGDILTPGYPSIDGMYRLPLAKATKDFSIPVQPISYRDAFHILRQMDGIMAPESWQGGLNITYKITMSDKSPREIKLVVNTEFRREKIRNVIATLEGKIEPDRVVLLGNHYDAWVFGGCDPSSGTATMMEIGRVLGEAKMSGWRPRRSIKVCAWDAEEFGLVGSTEWVEENANLLLYDTVAYINVDNAISGNYTIEARASAQMPDLLFHAATKVEDPDEKESSLFETWRRKSPDPKDNRKPSVLLPGSGSDYKTFFARMAVPVVDLRYTFDGVKYNSLSSYPMYHSLHDSFHFVETFMDRGFRHHSTIAALTLRTGLRIADARIIPFNFSSYATILQACYQSSLIYEPLLRKRNITLKSLKRAVERFTRAARHFHHVVDKRKFENDLLRRMINDKIMHIERAFIAPEGLPGRPYERHVIYSQSALDTYMGSCFPGLVDSVSNSLQKRKSDWTVPAEQLSKIIYHIRQATKLLSI